MLLQGRAASKRAVGRADQPPISLRARASRALDASRLRLQGASSCHRLPAALRGILRNSSLLHRKRLSSPACAASHRALRQPSTQCFQAAPLTPRPDGESLGLLSFHRRCCVLVVGCVFAASYAWPWVQREPLSPRRLALHVHCNRAAAASAARAPSPHWRPPALRRRVCPSGREACSPSIALPALDDSPPAVRLRRAKSIQQPAALESPPAAAPCGRVFGGFVL